MKKPKTPTTEQQAILHDFKVFAKRVEKSNRILLDEDKQRKEFSESESRIQQSCVAWYRNTYCLKHHNPRCMIFSIPNEGRGAASAPLISTGLYPGCADLCLIHMEYTTDLYYEEKLGERVILTFHLFIEIKTPENRTGPKKNGQSQKQIDFEEHCKQMGIPYFIVRSLEEFCQVIENL